MSADSTCPPTNAHGCANGLCEAANSSTAEAPMDATMNSVGPGLRNRLVTQASARMATSAPTALRSFSVRLA